MSTEDKTLAHNLKKSLEKRGLELKLGQVYDLIAEACGHKNHRTMKAVSKTPAVGLFQSVDTPVDDAPVIKTEYIGRYKYNVKVLAKATLSLEMEIQAPSMSEAFLSANEYIYNNENGVRDVAENWELEHMDGDYKVVEMSNENIYPPKFNYVEDKYIDVTDENWFQHSPLHIENLDGITVEEVVYKNQFEESFKEHQKHKYFENENTD